MQPPPYSSTVDQHATSMTKGAASLVISVEEHKTTEQTTNTRKSSTKTTTSSRTTYSRQHRFAQPSDTSEEDSAVVPVDVGSVTSVSFKDLPQVTEDLSGYSSGDNNTGLTHLESVSSVSTVSTCTSASTVNSSRTGSSWRTFSTTSSGSNASSTKKRTPVQKALRVPKVAVCGVFKVIFSISFTILFITVAAVIVPSLTLWRQAGKNGMDVLEQEYILVSVTDSANVLQQGLENSVSRCEQYAWSYAQFMNSLPDAGASGDMTQLKLNVWSSISLLLTNSCGSTMQFMSRGGYLSISLSSGSSSYSNYSHNYKNRTNSSYSGYSSYRNSVSLQTGFPPNASMATYQLNMTTWRPMYTKSLSKSSYYNSYNSPQGWMESIDSSTQRLLNNPQKVVWSKAATSGNSSKVLALKLRAGWITYDKVLRGALTMSLGTSDFGDFLEPALRDGVLCAFVADLDGCLVASSCENVTYKYKSVRYRKCINASFAEAQESYEFFQTHYANGRNASAMYMSDFNDSVVYGITTISTSFGFSAAAVIIADKDYYYKTYNRAHDRMVTGVSVAICISAFVALCVALFTFTAVWQVITRIHHIMDAGLGKKKDKKEPSVQLNPVRMLSPNNGVVTQNPEANTDEDAEVPTGISPEEAESGASNIFRKRSILSMFNIVSYMSEIRLILKKLDWLEGKVIIIAKFLPVVAKLVCKQGVSDEEVLNSKLTRRQGSYMFADIEGFTPLCEAVTPDVAGLVLESFYDAVEKAAHEHCNVDDVLIKRLGDGVMVCWGYKLAIEKNQTSRRLPLIAYAAAVRLGELAVQLDQRITDIVREQAPWWRCTIRCGITSGPALHGLLRTEGLMNPDVIGALINLAARCQAVGKLPLIKQLGQACLKKEAHPNDRVLCTVITDMATATANSTAATPQHPGVGRGLHRLAKASITRYPVHVVERVPVTGVGEVDLSTTFITVADASASVTSQIENTRK